MPALNQEWITLLSGKIGREEFEQRMKYMEGDLQEIKDSLNNISGKELKELREAILAKQKSSMRRIIAVQSAILLTVLTVLLSFVIPLVLKTFIH
jgi:type IV secretory pathway component VirB8